MNKKSQNYIEDMMDNPKSNASTQLGLFEQQSEYPQTEAPEDSADAVSRKAISSEPRGDEGKQGYRLTKLGWIPGDWEVKSLKKISKVTSGGTPSRNKPIYWGGDIPWITTSLINFNEIIEAEEYITKEGLNHSSAKLFEPDTILLALYGQGKTRGKVGILKVKAATNQACAAIILSDKQIDSSFVFFYLVSNYKNIRKLSNTGNQENLNGELVKTIHVPLPPLPEQRAIAACLSTWDKAIHHLTQLIDQKELRKKGLMQQLLTGKKRLPGFGGEWQTVRILDLFTEITAKNDGGNHEPLTISARQGFVSQKKKFDRVIAGDSLSNYTQIIEGDFAYNKGNSKLYEMGCIYQLEDRHTALVPFVYICFRSKETIDGLFYKQWFINHGLDRQLKKIITSGARSDGLLNVNKKDFFLLKLPFTSKAEQTAIANVLQCADQEIDLLRKKLAYLKEQKKGLMQQLLTGKKRLPLSEFSTQK